MRTSGTESGTEPESEPESVPGSVPEQVPGTVPDTGRQAGTIRDAMAAIKLVYLGGGSTRAPGTVAGLIAQGEQFAGSEVALVDLDEGRLEIVRRLAERMAQARGLDLRFSATTERRRALEGADAVLSSFRPGGFEARHLDESIPLRHGVIGQETQGPGGFFMALRSIAVLREVCGEMAELCPDALLVNYTNPVNLVAQAIADHSAISVVSLCEGPIYFPRIFAAGVGLDPDLIEATMVGLNHGCFSVAARYDGDDLLPLLDELDARRDREVREPWWDGLLRLAVTVRAVPADYMAYYYYRDTVLEHLRGKPTTRSQDIMGMTGGYWRHYEEQAARADPQLDPDLCRGGIDELELAVDVMDAVFNDRDEVWPVNVPNNGTIAELPDRQVVEVPGRCNASGIHPEGRFELPPPVRGLVKSLAEYQLLAADAAWDGDRRQAVQALAANPLVLDLGKAELLYDELAEAHRDHLPDRLVRT